MKKREEHKIIVVGLPLGSNSTDLTKLVRQYGNPLEANVAVDASGKERGFGFVRFSDAETQKAAIAGLDKTLINGRTLNVRAVEERAMPTSKVTAKTRPCFDFSRGKCTRGADCKWAHIAPVADQAASRRPEWQKKRPDAAGDAATLLSDIPEDYCRKYQFGSCHRGDSCRWKHIIWKGSTAAAPAAAAPKCLPVSAPPAPSASAAPAGLGAKRPRAEVAGGAAAAPKAARVGGEQGEAGGYDPIEQLRGQLRAREAVWRSSNAGQDAGAAVPEEAKNRDVVWRALERKLARALEARVA